MFLVSVLQRYWQQLAADDDTLKRLRTLEILRDEYMGETRLMRQLTEHSERMRYPEFRQRLLRMAQEQSEHLSWLREKIVELHGVIPEVEETLTSGKNTWECLLQDLAEEKRCCALLADQIAIAENFYPELTTELEHMFEEEDHHREEIMDMLIKSDPYAER